MTGTRAQFCQRVLVDDLDGSGCRGRWWETNVVSAASLVVLHIADENLVPVHPGIFPPVLDDLFQVTRGEVCSIQERHNYHLRIPPLRPSFVRSQVEQEVYEQDDSYGVCEGPPQHGREVRVAPMAFCYRKRL